MSSLVCAFCGKQKRPMWWCRICRMHFCGNCSRGGAFSSFSCPKGHKDVAKVSG